MNTGAKLGAFALVLGAALAAGSGIGAVAGPIDIGAEDHRADHGGDAVDAPLPAGGLLVSQDGYTLSPTDRLADEGTFSFTIDGPDGSPLTDYDAEHDEELHLVVASRDLREFVHVHPVRDERGMWSVDLPRLPPGSYRAFADLRPAGAAPVTLGVDLQAPGEVTLPPPLTPNTEAAVDGYEVRVTGDLVPGRDSTVVVTVTLDGETIETEPLLGAGGHLVVLRDGDLAYLHVHPTDSEGGPVRFTIEVPSTGTYALFFDFLHGGAVHTAHFVAATDHEHG